MAPFQGRLLVGVGRLLRIYDIGKKKMLRKCENKHIPNLIVDIHSLGSHIYVSDIQEAVHFVRYKPVENQLVVFADETCQRLWLHHLVTMTIIVFVLSRFMTSSCILDYNTVAAADKFGNIAIVWPLHHKNMCNVRCVCVCSFDFQVMCQMKWMRTLQGTKLFGTEDF